MFKQLVHEKLSDLKKGALGRESYNEVQAIVSYKLATPPASVKLITVLQGHVPQIPDNCCGISKVV